MQGHARQGWPAARRQHARACQARQRGRRAGRAGRAPSLTRPPVLSSAPSTHSWCMELRSVPAGGGRAGRAPRLVRPPVLSSAPSTHSRCMELRSVPAGGARGRARAQAGQAAGVVQRAQHPELEHGVEDVVARRRVHEVEVQQVVHVQGLEQQHHVAQVGALDLGHRHRQQLLRAGRCARSGRAPPLGRPSAERRALSCVPRPPATVRACTGCSSAPAQPPVSRTLLRLPMWHAASPMHARLLQSCAGASPPPTLPAIAALHQGAPTAMRMRRAFRMTGMPARGLAPGVCQPARRG